MAKYLALPDGNSVTIREGETPEQTWARAQRDFPASFPKAQTQETKPETGFFPAMRGTWEEMKGQGALAAGKAGIMELPAAEKYYKQQKEAAEKVYKPTEETWGQAPWTKLKELAGSSLPYMVAPAAAAAAAPETVVASALAAGIPSAMQFFGTNLGRQVDEGKSLAEASGTKAALAAVPQAALDVIGLRFIPGLRKIMGVAGKELTEAEAQALLSQTLKQKAADYAKATGKTMGVEGLTEAAQQVFERAQAGLNIADPQARQEYFDNFVGGAILGGTMAPAGRFFERGSEQSKAEALLLKSDLEKSKAEYEAEQAARKQKAAEKERPDLLTAMGDETVRGPYSLLPQAQLQKNAFELATKADIPAESLQGMDANEVLAATKQKLAQDLEEQTRVLSLLTTQRDAAAQANQMDKVATLNRQLGQVKKTNVTAEDLYKQVNKLAGPEFDPDVADAKRKKAEEIGDFEAAAKYAEQLHAWNQQQQALKTKVSSEATPPGITRKVEAIPKEQFEMFPKDWEKTQDKAELEDLESTYQGERGTAASRERLEKIKAKPSADEQMQRMDEEYQRELDERNLTQSMTLTPQQYLTSLQKQIGQDVTNAIDSGNINAGVRKTLGLAGLGNANLDLTNTEHVKKAETILRQKIEQLKTERDAFTAAHPTETSLYDVDGKLKKETIDQLKNDVQATEVNRLLQHIRETGTQQRADIVQAKIPTEDKGMAQLEPLQNMTVEDKFSVLGSLGYTKFSEWQKKSKEEVPETAEEKKIRQESQDKYLQDADQLINKLTLSGDTTKVDAQRHSIEARRQDALQKTYYDNLLTRLEDINRQVTQEGVDPHPADRRTAEEFGQKYIEAALKTAAHRRAAQGVNQLRTDQVEQARTDLQKLVSELITRNMAGKTTETVEVTGRIVKPNVGVSRKLEQEFYADGALKWKGLWKELKGKNVGAFKKYSNRIDQLTNRLVDLRSRMERLKKFVDPYEAAYKAMPEGNPKGTEEQRRQYAAREAAMLKFKEVEKPLLNLAKQDAGVTEALVKTLQEVKEKHVEYTTFDRDVRSLRERPFAAPVRAEEVIFEELNKIIAGLSPKESIETTPEGKIKFKREGQEIKRVEQHPVNYAQELLRRISEAKKEIASIKGKHGTAKRREGLENRIESLTTSYNKLMADQEGMGMPPTANIAALKKEIEEAYTAKDYATVAQKSEQLRIAEQDHADTKQANAEEGQDLEKANQQLTRAINDAKVELEEITTGIRPEPAKEVKVGERPPVKRALDASQTRRMGELNKQLNQLESAYTKNNARLKELGMYGVPRTEGKELTYTVTTGPEAGTTYTQKIEKPVAGADFKTEDMFEKAPEQGVIFDTPEQYLGSAKSGKIAKLRKQLRDVQEPTPIAIEELQGARTDYVAAQEAYAKLRKMAPATANMEAYYDAVRLHYKNEIDSLISGVFLSKEAFAKQSETASYKIKVAKLEEKIKRIEAKRKAWRDMRAKMAEFPETAEVFKEADAEALATAEQAVEAARKNMEEADSRARRNGIIYPEEVAPEPGAVVAETPAATLEKQIKDANKVWFDLREAPQQPEETAEMRRTAIADAKNKLVGLQTKKSMQTFTGRLKIMRDNLASQLYVSPTDPLSTALGRAQANLDKWRKSIDEQDKELKQYNGWVAEFNQTLADLEAAPAPTNVTAWHNYYFDVVETQEKVEAHIENIQKRKTALVNAENEQLGMFLMADKEFKKTWEELKKLEAQLVSGTPQTTAALAKRRTDLMAAEKVLQDAKDAAAQKTKDFEQRIGEGLSLPGTKVTRIKALSKEGKAAATAVPVRSTVRYYDAEKEVWKTQELTTTSYEVETTSPGWSVVYTEQGPVFNYDPTKDPNANDKEKAAKNQTYRRAYDNLKKARNALARAEGRKVGKEGTVSLGTDAQIAIARVNLERAEKRMEDLAGARKVTVRELTGESITASDLLIEKEQDVLGLWTARAANKKAGAEVIKEAKANLKKYFTQRAEQERLRKEIDRNMKLVGQTDLSNTRKAVREAKEALGKENLKINELKSLWESGYAPYNRAAHDAKVRALETAAQPLKDRLAALEAKLGPMEKANEEKITKLRDGYIVAKKTADEMIGIVPEERIRAERVTKAENVKDLAATSRTLAVQEAKGADIKPLTKRNQQLRSATSDESKVISDAKKLAKHDRLVTMHPKGSVAYDNALKEVTRGYMNRFMEVEEDPDIGDVVLRLEGSPPANPVDPVAAQRAAAEYARGLPKDVKFVYAPTLLEAPAKFLKALFKNKIDVEKSAVKGGVLPDGTIVIIGNMHTSLADLEETLVHEAIGHYGVDMVLGPKGMAELTRNIRTADGGIFGMAQALGVEADVVQVARGYENLALDEEKKENFEKATELRRLGEIQAVREMIAHLQERTVNESLVEKAGRYLQIVLGAIRKILKSMGFVNTANVNTSELYHTLFQASRKMQQEYAGTYMSPTGLLSLRAEYAADFANAGRYSDRLVAKNKNWWDGVKANFTGLGFETQFVDRFGGWERLAQAMDSVKGRQMMYYFRMYDQRQNFVSQAVQRGALKIVEKTRKDGQIERLIEASDGASIRGVVNILKQAEGRVGNSVAVNRLFTMYMSAIRADSKGFDTLHFGKELTKTGLDRARAQVENNPQIFKIFEAARKEYNAYNRGMIDFLLSVKSIDAKTHTNLLAQDDYIPWYRQRGGIVELVIGNESPIRIGDVANQPHLDKLVGGDEAILDFLTSSVQNTGMLADMGMRNLATKNAVYEMVELGLAKIGKGRGTGTNVIHFTDMNKDGQLADLHAVLLTDKVGLDPDILVKGMEGIPTQLSGIMKMMAFPATILRKAVTLSPVYMAKQIFRDSFAASIASGANTIPVMSALKEIRIGSGKTKDTLERRGITGGQVFTGGTEEITNVLNRMLANKTVSWQGAIGALEAMNMEADASTRRAQYNSYIKQGMSEMEATLMSLEAMNFNKRGASPSVHWLNSMIPFFNAQVQSLNVLYKAITGKMPHNEKLKIQQKLFIRGAMLAASSMMYAALMQDDEAYKNATPDQKYGNWFIRIPGMEEPLRLSIPFEIGYLFKALPEAIYNSMVDEHGGEEAVKAFNTILLSLIPGGSNMPTFMYDKKYKVALPMPIPQAVKPLVEFSLGKSFYTGRDLLSEHEKKLQPEAQFRQDTTDIAKMFGQFGMSPILVENLIRSYTTALPLALGQAILTGTGAVDDKGPERATLRPSESKIYGTLFQPEDAGAIIDRVYQRMNTFEAAKATYKDYIDRGYYDKAEETLNKFTTEIALAETATKFQTEMRKATKMEVAIRAADMPPNEKSELLKAIRQQKIDYARINEQVLDEIERP
jgi:hypothetical protein